jgi:hypothetical protein
MADPRFLLSCGTGSHRGGAAWWAGGRGGADRDTGMDRGGAAAPDAEPDEAAGQFWYAWRLTGANNRELGRSPGIFPSVAACVEAAALVMREVAGAEVEVGTDPRTRLWSWRLALGGQPVAVSGRQYQRNRECLYNLERFLAAAPVAQISPDPVPVRPPDGGTRSGWPPRPALMVGLA